MTFHSFSLCPIAYLMALKLMRISTVGPWKCEFIYTLFLSPFFFHLPLTLVPQFKWSVAFVTNGAKVSFWLFPGPFHLTWDLIKLKTQSVWGQNSCQVISCYAQWSQVQSGRFAFNYHEKIIEPPDQRTFGHPFGLKT